MAGNYADFTYWGPASTAAGVNKKAVNWDGYNHISDQNYLIRNALDHGIERPGQASLARREPSAGMAPMEILVPPRSTPTT